jgi:hypothetical protein
VILKTKCRWVTFLGTSKYSYYPNSTTSFYDMKGKFLPRHPTLMSSPQRDHNYRPFMKCMMALRFARGVSPKKLQ